MKERKLWKAAWPSLSAVGLVTTLFLGDLCAETTSTGAPQTVTSGESQRSGEEPKATASEGDTARTVTPVAPASPSAEDIELAKSAFEAGAQAYADADYIKAESEFRIAHEKIPSPHAEYWIAASMDKANKPAKEVVRAYELFLTNPAAIHVGEEAVETAKKRASELKATLPATVLIESTPAGAEVYVDGALIAGKTPVEIELPAGTHRLELRASGYEVSLVEIDAVAGSHVRAPIELQKQVAVPTTDAAALGQEPAPKKERSMVPAYVTLGIGAAGLISGTVFGILALDAKSKYDKGPTAELADEVERNALISDMSFGVALTLGITGVVLLTAKDDEVPAAKAARRAPGRVVVAPYGGPLGGGAVARMAF
ncbi:MAG: hypothetical protein B6A08_06340 [Sorangiineae bacterium NIC37A_2]|jgi:hypothetical protein|nr:MAG: hypothetical protein B6A08_18725 [Sorangiineae bacterium NIC37A_2]OQX69301.1 MAG: hypothetical protein B6A08_06340 [Sorangiineae bacterium NIC37A_2]